jgi:hypothetical protein
VDINDELAHIANAAELGVEGPNGIFIYITNLVCYTYFHWFFNPECQLNRSGICDAINRCNIFLFMQPF